MTRMWMVRPVWMCREHLLGEHNELHKLVGSIRSHPHGEAIAEGHAEKGNIDTSLINRRHMMLVEEMEERGYNHDSPLAYEPDEPQHGLGCIDVVGNRMELMERCSGCRDKMEFDVRRLEDEWGI